MPLLLTGKKFHNDLKTNKCLAIFAPLEGGYETRLLRRMRAKGFKTYITSFLFKLKSKPAALYQSLGGFAINGVNLTKLQSYPEKNSFDSYFFLCDLDGHIEDPKVQKSLEELGLHCEDFHVLGVFEADSLRQKK